MNNLRYLRKREGMTMKELGAAVGVTESAVGLWENGKRTINYDMLIELAHVLNCSIGDITGKETPIREESALERKYNALDAHGKAVVDSVLDLELKRCTGPVKAAGRIIPLFPAAAGPGDLAEGEPFEEYETDNDKADFAVRISGDSMEPHFKGVGRLENAAWVQIPSSAPSTQKSLKCVVFGYFFVPKACLRLIPRFCEKM